MIDLSLAWLGGGHGWERREAFCRRLDGGLYRQRPPWHPTTDPNEKNQSVVLRHLLSWWRVVLGEILPHFLRAGQRLNTFYREECLEGELR